MKTWFITGTSRGFGREWAIAAPARGDRVTPADIYSRPDQFPSCAARPRASQAGPTAPEGTARPIAMSAAHAQITVAQISPVAIQSSPTPGPVGLAPAAHASSAQAPPITAHPSASAE